MAVWDSSAVGQFTTDRNLVVQSWDAWMAAATGIEESTACGQRLDVLFPELLERGLLSRLTRVAEGRGVEVLAPALHKYLVPCAPLDPTSRFEHMRQHVTIAPLVLPDGPAGVMITIKDVTSRFDRESRLAADLDSTDQRVRLGATEALAAQRSSPMLLAGALSDSSWRVRRAAAAGLARTGGAQVQETLVEALRDNHRNLALLNSALSALADISDDLTGAVAALLEHEDADTRTYAALALGLIRDPDALPALLARLEDDDQNVRFHAIEALGRIGDRRAVEPIAAVAESRDFFLAFAALDALAGMGDSGVAPRLVPLLDDPFLGAAAATCLGAIGQEDVAAPMAAALENESVDAKAIAIALGAMYARMEDETGHGAVLAEIVRHRVSADAAARVLRELQNANDDEARSLVPMLSWLHLDGVDAALAAMLSQPGVRNIAAEALVARGVRASRFIERTGNDGDDETRKAAARALGRIGGSDALSALLSWLQQARDVDSLTTVIGALATVGDRRAFEPLLGLMDHHEATVRQAVVSALNSVGHPDTEAAIRERLADASPRVRECAVRVACNFGYPSLLEPTIELCADPDDVVRRAAVEALGSFESQHAAGVIDRVLSSDDDAAVRAAAARALGHWESAESLAALLVACRDENLWVRYYAARALGRRAASNPAIVAMLSALASNDPVVPVRLAAIETLGTIAAPDSGAVLLSLARAPEAAVACAALVAMGSSDSATTSAELSSALQSPDETVQDAALRALCEQRAPYAVSRIAEIARGNATGELRTHAVRALGCIGSDEAIRALVELSANVSVRRSALRELADLRGDRVSALWSIAQDAPANVRELAVEAIGRITGKEAQRALAAALQDEEPRVRTAATRALARLDARPG